MEEKEEEEDDEFKFMKSADYLKYQPK